MPITGQSQVKSGRRRMGGGAGRAWWLWGWLELVTEMQVVEIEGDFSKPLSNGILACRYSYYGT